VLEALAESAEFLALVSAVDVLDALRAAAWALLKAFAADVAAALVLVPIELMVA
jgi:hypothetical protein